MPRVTTHTSPMVKRSKVKVDRRINAVIENKPHLKSPLLQGGVDILRRPRYGLYSSFYIVSNICSDHSVGSGDYNISTSVSP